MSKVLITLHALFVPEGCRIQVTQGYTRGTTVLRDAEVDKALSGSASSDGADSSSLTVPQSSVKAGNGSSIVGAVASIEV